MSVLVSCLGSLSLETDRSVLRGEGAANGRFRVYFNKSAEFVNPVRWPTVSEGDGWNAPNVVSPRVFADLFLPPGGQRTAGTQPGLAMQPRQHFGVTQNEPLFIPS